MQVLIRNPLADPYILGVSGGAAAFSLLGTLFGLSLHFNYLAGFFGAALAALLVWKLAHSNHQLQPSRLLLTGVVMAAAWGALISLILILSPAGETQGMLFWLMGDFSYSPGGWLPVIVLLICFAAAWLFAPSMDILIWGDKHARSLGVNVPRLLLLLFSAASAATAVAVTTAGSIGFAGLIIPHLMRLLMGYQHRILVPACVLAGGSFLLLADTLARTVMLPEQLPVGILTAIIGVPIFLILLHRNAHYAV